MYEQSLIQSGLTEEMAEVYELLLRSGSLPAGKISKKIGLKRGLTYKSLDRLLEKGLIEKKEDEGKVAIFGANHPLKLEEMVQSRKQKAANAELALGGVLSSLVSDFNLMTGKPGVVFYEGDDGFKKVLFDSLAQSKIIYQFVDIDTANKSFAAINAPYMKKRLELNIKKLMITTSGDYVRKYQDKYDPDLSDIRYLDKESAPFPSSMMVYGNKISFLNLRADKKIGIILEDAYIAQTMKTIFEFVWRQARPLSVSQPQPETKIA